MGPSYEDIRLENIRKNKALLEGLQIAKLKEIVPTYSRNATLKKKQAPLLARKKTVVPVRSSLRLKGLQPDATPVPPTLPLVPPSFPTAAAKPASFSANEAFLEGNTQIVSSWANIEKDVSVENNTPLDANAKQVKSWFSPFHSDSGPIPVTPSRVYSTVFAPLSSKYIACVGDKVGSLSLWDITNYVLDPTSDIPTSVCTFQPHSGALSQAHFLEPHLLSTLSFDGTLRQFDLHHQSFSTLFTTSKDETLHALDQHHQSLWISTGLGHILHLDLREKQVVRRLEHVHEKKCGCIHLHRTQPHYLVTSSNDRSAKLIDLRTEKILTQYPHPRSCTSGYFSPDSTSIVTTSYDNTIRVWQQPRDVAPSFSDSLTTISHCTQTGKWVTPFRAKWHPTFSDTIFVANMNRSVDIYQSTTGKRLCNLSSDDMTAVPAVIGFHPSKSDMFITGNASGKCHIFTRSPA